MTKSPKLPPHLLTALLLALVLSLEIFFLDRRRGSFPPLGKLLHPQSGAWSSPDDDLGHLRKIAKLPGLEGKVTVFYDRHRIPHLFAQNDSDLYAAQGFIMAHDRLWQMEFGARLTSGRLSQVMGKKTLEVDKLFIRMGLPEVSEASFQLLQKDPVVNEALLSFARGVNAYIESLDYASLPIEYKIFDVRPEKWKPINSVYLMKYMAYSMSLWGYDLRLTRTASRLSPKDFAELFPLRPKTQAPMVPKGTTWPFSSAKLEAPEQEFTPRETSFQPVIAPAEGNGSNSWVVSAKRSATGRNMIANDVHLGFQLPSLWYELQLQSPKQNSYGVTIPGVPGITLGFNHKIAWAVTNGVTDASDWYELRFKDQAQKEYLFQDQWLPVKRTKHRIRVWGEKDVEVEGLGTHHGPILYSGEEAPLHTTIARGLAFKWTGLLPSQEVRTFLGLNRAASFEDCLDAIKWVSSPVLNIACADEKNIGMYHQGTLPVKWEGQGRMILSASDPKHQWNHGHIPQGRLPHVINPDDGIIFSTNQAPADKTYPYYLNGPYEVPYREKRIQQLLNSKAKFTAKDMLQMQQDSTLLTVEEVLPLLLKIKPKGLTKLEEEALTYLRKWDGRFVKKSVAATIFHHWFQGIRDRMWQEMFPSEEDYQIPNWSVTAQILLKDAESKWFDDATTKRLETREDLITQEFSKTLALLTKKHGPDLTQWTWETDHPSLFPYFMRIPGLGQSKPLASDGHPYTLNSNRSAHGPVWSSVVVLGNKIEAWGIYPGGQSGNPSSQYYETFLEDWGQGQNKRLDYFQSTEEVPEGYEQIIFEGGQS